MGARPQSAVMLRSPSQISLEAASLLKGQGMKPTPRGERSCVPTARLDGWLLAD